MIALRDRGFPVEYMLAPDEGHGFARPVNNMAMFMAAEKFLAKYLGGTLPGGETPEVTARLKEITVDPKTVVLAKKVDAAAVGVPKTAAASAGRNLQIQGERSKWAPKPSRWTTLHGNQRGKRRRGRVTDSDRRSMGELTDTPWSSERTPSLSRKRSIHQGPVAIELAFRGQKGQRVD